jgi:hypothetical protein
MKTYIVQLETHDDVISAKDKIAWSKARRVLLVWPRRGKVLERQVDLLLLLRHAQKLGTQLAIVTGSGEVKTNARQLGIAVFRNTAQAQKSNWLRHYARRKFVLQPRSPADAGVLREQREMLRSQPREKLWLRLSAFALGILAFMSLVMFFAPAASVALKPIRKTQALTINVWANPDIPVANPSGGLPARLVAAEVEGRDQIQSSGQAWIPDQPSVGEVVLTNLTDQAVEVPAGSVVLTSIDPVVHFIIAERVTLPAEAGAKVKVLVRAAVPGRSGNVASGQIRAMEGPAGLRLAVENPLPTRAGSDRRAPAPTTVDERQLRDKLLSDLEIAALDEMQGRLQSGQRLLRNTVKVKEIIEELREPRENTPADRLLLSMRVEFEAWYVDDSDLQIVSLAALNATQEKGFEPVPGSLRFAFPSELQLDKTGGSSGSLSARGELQIEQMVEAVMEKEKAVEAVRGHTIQDAQKILQSRLSLAQAPEIAMYPGWWGRLPFLPFRISVVKQ